MLTSGSSIGVICVKINWRRQSQRPCSFLELNGASIMRNYGMGTWFNHKNTIWEEVALLCKEHLGTNLGHPLSSWAIWVSYRTVRTLKPICQIYHLYIYTSQNTRPPRSLLRNLADIVKYDWYCDIWLMLWNWVKIVIFGRYCDI